MRQCYLETGKRIPQLASYLYFLIDPREVDKREAEGVKIVIGGPISTRRWAEVAKAGEEVFDPDTQVAIEEFVFGQKYCYRNSPRKICVHGKTDITKGKAVS